jgi:hypothetical protein
MNETTHLVSVPTQTDIEQLADAAAANGALLQTLVQVAGTVISHER